MNCNQKTIKFNYVRKELIYNNLVKIIKFAKHVITNLYAGGGISQLLIKMDIGEKIFFHISFINVFLNKSYVWNQINVKLVIVVYYVKIVIILKIIMKFQNQNAKSALIRDI